MTNQSADMARHVECLWQVVTGGLLRPETGLIYDFAVDDTPDGAVSALPTPQEIALGMPNPNGWGTGMEDSVISNAMMLETVLLRHESEGTASLEPLAHALVSGLLLCASVSPMEGFLARSVSPFDRKSHYVNSSRDQYTHWVWAACRYLRAPLCTETERTAIARCLTAFARKAERDIVPENHWTLLREDGRQAVVSQLWGDVDAHEALRLPMIYLAAWRAGGDPHWRELYLRDRDEGVRRSQNLPDSFWAAYPGLQMQYSLRLIYDLEEDEALRTRLLQLMGRVALLQRAHTLRAEGPLRAGEIDCLLSRPWRDCPMNADQWARMGVENAFNPVQPAACTDAFYCFHNVGGALLSQALCPSLEIPAEQSTALSLALSRYAEGGFRDRAAITLLAAWYLLQARRTIAASDFRH